MPLAISINKAKFTRKVHSESPWAMQFLCVLLLAWALVTKRAGGAVAVIHRDKAGGQYQVASSPSGQIQVAGSPSGRPKWQDAKWPRDCWAPSCAGSPSHPLLNENASQMASLPDPALTLEPWRSPIYLEHVMKTGGTDACAAHRLSRGCSVNAYWNCRLTGYATTRWLNKTSGLHPTHPDLTAELVQRGAQSTPSICGIVSEEQGWTGLGNSPGKIRYMGSCSFWDAYTTVLLVRDPWMRFVSHYKMLQKQDSMTAGVAGSGAQSLPDELMNRSNTRSTRVWNLWNNFFTKHLVPGFRMCTSEALRRGKEAIDRFTVVLNIIDFPTQSAHIASARLSWSLSLDHEAGAKRVGTFGSAIFTGSEVHKDSIQASRRFRTAFSQANTCDHALVAHANARVHLLYRENML